MRRVVIVEADCLDPHNVLGLQRLHLITHPYCASLTHVRRVVRVRRSISGTQSSGGNVLLLPRIRLIKGGVERFFSACQLIYFLLLHTIALYIQHALRDVVEFEMSSTYGTSVSLRCFNFILFLIVVAFKVVQVSCTCCRKVDAFT